MPDRGEVPSVTPPGVVTIQPTAAAATITDTQPALTEPMEATGDLSLRGGMELCFDSRASEKCNHCCSLCMSQIC
ncbi:hypothetical protein LMH87_000806 [Akanthomyces muscarius]|uniref:Uncharacterized protein n=1 Tax=Akanthomyces muscarius TaxID=2231603 RepID=A0A9W8ULF9_AKAMU|nr:hypothetical protein LMH87_000806 [Akanthomyces muscarius]KAJ4155568.1 hypothetical protein LMH87_000806 [Akanthomyces muscarius]